MKDDKIWYVCYGSNINLERFMVYITGEYNAKYDIKSKDGVGCADKSEPSRVKDLEINYELYFAEHSGFNWEDKGVAFVKPTKDENVHTKARAYLVTNEQFECIWKQEGKGWYDHRIELEPIDDIPAATFTSKYERSYNAPGEKYIRVIRDGLMDYGLSEDAASKYIEEHIH